MINEVKAREIALKSIYLSDFPHCIKSEEHGALRMAEWKDKQFKEYLEKKRDSIEMDYCKDSYEGNAYKHSMLMEIINELFNNDTKD